jgi:hypothetical protein
MGVVLGRARWQLLATSRFNVAAPLQGAAHVCEVEMSLCRRAVVAASIAGFLGLGVTGRGSGQVAASDRNQISLLVSAVRRDVKDYFVARSTGFGLALVRESPASRQLKVTLGADVAFFSDEKITIPALALRAPLNESMPSAASFDWDPGTGNRLSSSLAVFGVRVGLRRFFGASVLMPYAGASLGLVELLADEQHTLRPSLSGAFGLAWRPTEHLRLFLEGGADWTGLDFTEGAARSPRWLLRPAMGVAVTP